MKRLFVELYFDEDVSDEEQLARAVSQSRALVSHNRADFEALAEQYFAAQRTYYGIILAVRRSPYEVMRRLLAIINNLTADEMQNQLLYI